MKESILILAGGGPAPGINTVEGTIAKAFMAEGYRVLGLHGGYSGIFSASPNFIEFNFALADAIFNRGGSYLQMSRYKPSQEDFDRYFNLKFFQENNIRLLVTIGGDDTASTANRIGKFLREKKYPVQNIHVPKTIDNDLPLPMNAPTFGYNSAKAEGTRIATTVYEDARTSGNWSELSAEAKLYPNPTADIFTIEGANVDKVEVYNLVGQKVYGQQGCKVVNIDASSWNKGIYLVNIIEQSGAVVTKKLVVR